MRVSLPLTAGGGRIRAIVAALCAVTLLVIVAAAPSAHASFTVTHCKGAAIEGQGSSAQKEAQLEFWSTTVFHGSEAQGGCTGSAPHVEYIPNGSGCGIASIGGAKAANCSGFTEEQSGPGFRAPGTRFAGSDAPLSVVQQTAADAAGGPKPGLIHQIPVASFAVAIIVHFPDRLQDHRPRHGRRRQRGRQPQRRYEHGWT